MLAPNRSLLYWFFEFAGVKLADHISGSACFDELGLALCSPRGPASIDTMAAWASPGGVLPARLTVIWSSFMVLEELKTGPGPGYHPSGG